MIRKMHFISGLPRSGSTLLSALLQQNPRFSAAITSPLAMLCASLQHRMSGTGEFSMYFTDELRKRVLRGLFEAYYAEKPADQIIFDTNRTWTGWAGLISALYPDCRIIACVRHIGWILDSIERMLNRNPLRFSHIFDFPSPQSVFGRAESLLDADKGLIGKPWSNLRECWYGEHARKLIVIKYDDLAREPGRIINALYEELAEDPYPHDFDRIAYDNQEYDALLGMPGLHSVRSKVEIHDRHPIIPPELFAEHASLNFWETPEFNVNNVRIL